MPDDRYDVSAIEARARAAPGGYVEFLRVPMMTAGIYALPEGGTDGQSPHTEDEIYYVLGGRARFRVAGRDRSVGPGVLLFVRAGDEHRFHDIEEALSLLVVFAPAEGTGGASGAPSGTV